VLTVTSELIRLTTKPLLRPDLERLDQLADEEMAPLDVLGPLVVRR